MLRQCPLGIGAALLERSVQKSDSLEGMPQSLLDSESYNEDGNAAGEDALLDRERWYQSTRTEAICDLGSFATELYLESSSLRFPCKFTLSTCTVSEVAR